MGVSGNAAPIAHKTQITMEINEKANQINWIVALKIAWRIIGVIIEVLNGKEDK